MESVRAHRARTLFGCLQFAGPYFAAVSACAARYRKVMIWPRVQGVSGEKVVSVVPLVMPFSTAHSTAWSAYQ